MRTIVDLPEEQIKALAEMGRIHKMSRAELLRRAVAEYLRSHAADEAEEAFGIWKNRGEEGLAYQERLREEWDE